MNTSFFYKGLFLILIGIGLSSQSNADAPNHDDAAKSGDIIGQLSMCLGSSEGLRVYISGLSFEAITDSVGNFKISYVQPGTYNLTITQNGNTVGIIPDVTVIAKQTANIGTESLCLDNDSDGYAQDVDCNDSNPAIHPEAAEQCNGIDDNCDGQVDEGCGGQTSCIDNSDCLSSQYCDSTNTCVALQSNGSFCTNSYECESNNCIDDICTP